MATKVMRSKAKFPVDQCWEVTEKIDKMSFDGGWVILEVPRVERARQDQGPVGPNPSGFLTYQAGTRYSFTWEDPAGLQPSWAWFRPP